MTTKESERIALLDMDCSLADFELSMYEKLVELMSPEELASINLEQFSYPNDVPDWFRARKTLIKKQPGFWSGLPVIEFGMDLYQLLGTLGYIRMILTKGPRNNSLAWYEKTLWCQEHVPDAGVTITHDKGLVYGKVLYDDYPPYVLRWLEWRPRGKVLMLDSKHNQGFQHPNVLRCYRQPIAQQLELILKFLGDL